MLYLLPGILSAPFDLLSSPKCFSASGDMEEVEHLCKRSRSSMMSLLQLSETPSINDGDNGNKKDEEEIMRQEPLEGEISRIWAIEGDDGPASRQQLPEWVALPIEKAICLFMEQRQKWNDLIESRMPKALTPTQQRKYEAWLADNSEVKLLYSMEKQNQVTRLRGNVNMDAIQKTMFSLHLFLSEDEEKLRLKAGGHTDSKRLVLLESDPVKGQVPCVVPDVVAGAGVDPAVLDNLHLGAHAEEEEEANFANDEQMDAMVEADALEQAEKDIAFQQEDIMEICAQSSDEEIPQTQVPVKRVKEFNHRPEYVKLSGLGLTMLPTHRTGVYLSHHSTSNCWQSFYPGTTTGLSFSYGGKTKRISIRIENTIYCI